MIISKILSDIKKAAKLVKNASSAFENIKAKEITNIKNIPTRSFQHSDIDLNKMKRKFGEMFYGLLEPINGSLPKNRRFSDGSSKHQGHSTPEGPCVFHRLGEMSKYSSRAYWYTSQTVFEKLKQEHVDLVVNGTRVRKDHKNVAQEFLDTKNSIEDKIGVIYSNDSRLLPLSQSYALKGILYKKSGNDLSIPAMEVDVIIKEATILGEDLQLHYVISPASKTRMDEKEIKMSYQNHGYISMPLTSYIDHLPTDAIDWNYYITILGLNAPFSDPKIDTHFTDSTQLKEESKQLLDDLEDKYSSRLIAQGLF